MKLHGIPLNKPSPLGIFSALFTTVLTLLIVAALTETVWLQLLPFAAAALTGALLSTVGVHCQISLRHLLVVAMYTGIAGTATLAAVAFLFI